MCQDHVDFIPAVTLMRTELERRDQHASWNRPDDAFFAAGACHVLAVALQQRHPGEGYDVILLRPHHDLTGTLVYVASGQWAFEFNSWTRENVLLAKTATECRRRWPEWDGDRIAIRSSLEDFCRPWNHRLPSEYAGDAMARAVSYLKGFAERPPAL
jgi:hypothetical protein